MFKLMGKKIMTILRSTFCLTGPTCTGIYEIMKVEYMKYGSQWAVMQ